MSITPAFGIAQSFASSSLALAKGADADRAAGEVAEQVTAIEANEKSDDTAGLGEAEEQSGAGERDADGRRMWELAGKRTEEEASASGVPPDASPVKDASGQRGTRLDLLG
jgi:hypothetical protein